MIRRKHLLKVVLLRVGLILKTNLASKIGFPTKYPMISPSLEIIGSLTLGRKKEEVSFIK